LRAWVYADLGGVFHTVPLRLSPPEGEARAFPRTCDAIRAACESFATRPREQIEADLVRLFVNAAGGVPAPPYASWYLDGRLLGPASIWAEEEYRRQCLEIGADAGQPADFIGTEFEYLYFLCRHQRAAQATGDRKALDLAIAAQIRFHRRHLARWLPAFTRAIRGAAAGGFFHLVAAILDSFRGEEGQHLAHLKAASAVPTKTALRGADR
jgi:TorA maturation chaperone TorD